MSKLVKYGTRKTTSVARRNFLGRYKRISISDQLRATISVNDRPARGHGHLGTDGWRAFAGHLWLNNGGTIEYNLA